MNDIDNKKIISKMNLFFIIIGIIGGLLVVISLAGYRYYSGLSITNKFEGISSKMDTIEKKSIDELNQKKLELSRELETSFGHIEGQITEESKTYLKSLKKLNKKINQSYNSVNDQIQNFENAIDFNSFNLTMTLEASSDKGITHYKSGLLTTTIVDLEFYQNFNNKSIKVITRISPMAELAPVKNTGLLFGPPNHFFFTDQKLFIRSIEGDLENIRIDKPIVLLIKPSFSPKELIYFELSYGLGKAFSITQLDGMVNSNIKQEVVIGETHNYLKLKLNEE